MKFILILCSLLNVFLQVKPKKARKKENKPVSREIIEDKDDSSGGEVPAESVHSQIQDSSNHKDSKVDEAEVDEKKKTKKKDIHKKKKKDAGPMHFTANSEPRALDVLGDLEPAIFNEVQIH